MRRGQWGREVCECDSLDLCFDSLRSFDHWSPAKEQVGGWRSHLSLYVLRLSFDCLRSVKVVIVACALLVVLVLEARDTCAILAQCLQPLGGEQGHPEAFSVWMPVRFARPASVISLQ